MNEQTITALIQVGALATQTVIEYLRAPPVTPADSRARDAATMALMEQAKAIGEALRRELGAAPPVPEVKAAIRQAATVEPPSVSAPPPADNTRDPRRAMAATIWGEARSEPLAGRIAVGWVIRNRVGDPGWWGKDVLSCCLSPAQFSCWWDKQGQAVRTVDETDLHFRQALQIAGEVMTGDLADPTAIGGQTGADHYHRNDVRPAWAVGHKPMFYRLGGSSSG